MIRIFVPNDSAAIAVGANQVAQAIVDQAQALGLSLQLVRNGSRGLYWLEPLIEVETAEGRVAYGPVRAEDISSLLAAEFYKGAPHPLYLGLTAEIPFLKNQERVCFSRCGLIDPLSLTDYCANGGFKGLEKALSLTPLLVIDEVSKSGLRGRGGAGFPTGLKWKTVADTPAAQKYICCNADEGDSGTYADRMLMEGDPFLIIEGMLIAAYAVGATRGYIYIRSEYPAAAAKMKQAISLATEHLYLGAESLTKFMLEVRVGAGTYICGEETAMLESLEGKRGMVRAKPPLPAISGLFGKPTVINNVLSLAAVPFILAHGAAAHHALGVGRSRGSLVVQLSGNIKQAGLVEKAFGVSLHELLYNYGAGARTGKPIRAVQVGGPLGAYLPPSQFHLPLDYEAFSQADAMLGHGGIIAFDETVDMSLQARFAFAFCAHESCGKCTPCRIGAVRGVEVIDRIRTGDKSTENLQLLDDLCHTMTHGSLCALGGLTPLPVQSALKYFSEDFQSATKGAPDVAC